MRNQFSLNACLTKARLAMADGRIDECVDELRQGIFESARLSTPSARKQVESILHFAHEHEIFSEVEETLDDEPLRRYFFGEG